MIKKPLPVVRIKYSDDQPRDEDGKWSDGGGSGGGSGGTGGSGSASRGALSASETRGRMSTLIQSLGYKRTEVRQTPGMLSAWFSPTTAPAEHTEASMRGMAERLSAAGFKGTFHPYSPREGLSAEIRGKDFVMSPQGKGSYVLQVYRKGLAGDQARQGMDT